MTYPQGPLVWCGRRIGSGTFDQSRLVKPLEHLAYHCNRHSALPS
jgi:hypothetical protein